MEPFNLVYQATTVLEVARHQNRVMRGLISLNVNTKF